MLLMTIPLLFDHSWRRGWAEEKKGEKGRKEMERQRERDPHKKKRKKEAQSKRKRHREKKNSVRKINRHKHRHVRKRERMERKMRTRLFLTSKFSLKNGSNRTPPSVKGAPREPERASAH